MLSLLTIARRGVDDGWRLVGKLLKTWQASDGSVSGISHRSLISVPHSWLMTSSTNHKPSLWDTYQALTDRSSLIERCQSTQAYDWSSEPANQIVDQLPTILTYSHRSNPPLLLSYRPSKNPTQPLVRSGVGTYSGAARRRVHLATVLPRPLSDHRPGRRQARHAHFYWYFTRSKDVIQFDESLLSSCYSLPYVICWAPVGCNARAEVTKRANLLDIFTVYN